MSDEIRIRVLPETVPTTASPFHPRATHADALGMPVAFSGEERWPYHPTPCCGAAATCSDGPDLYCKRCYEEVDPAYGNVPVEPFRPITPTEEELVNAAERNAVKAAVDAARRERLLEDNDPIIPRPKTNGATRAREEAPVARKTDTTGKKATAKPDPKKKETTRQRRTRGPAGAKAGATKAPETTAPETAPETTPPADLNDWLLDGVRARVAGIERIDAKSGSYYRLRLGKRTLGYVNPSKRGLILDLATPRDKVPAGVEVKAGPTGTLPVKFAARSEADVATAVDLVALAAEQEEVAPTA